MEGEFRFNRHGFATVVSAPDWSQALLSAVQGSYFAAASELAEDDSATVTRVLSELDKTIDAKIERASQTDRAAIQALQRQLKTEKDAPTPKRRSRLISALKAAGFAISIYAGTVGAIADTVEVAEWVTEVFGWGNEQYIQDLEPRAEQLPPYLQKPPNPAAQP